MHVYLNDLPSRLTRDKGLFSVKNDEGEQRLSPYQVKSFCLTRACMISTDAMLLALQHEIPIILLEPNGRPSGQLWSHQYGSIATIRRQQIQFSRSPKASAWMIDRLSRKGKGQMNLFEGFLRNKGKKSRELTPHMENMKLQLSQLRTLRSKPSLKNEAATIRAIEGNLTLHYHKAVNLYLPKTYRFSQRSRRPARDLYNAALNYAFGMLYNLVNTALLSVGLDPYLSVFHAEQHNRAAFSFDFIEPYRPWAEGLVLQLCRDKVLTDAHSQPVKGGIWLNEAGRRLLIETVNGFLNEKIQAGKRRLQRRFHIHREAEAFAQQLIQRTS